MMPSHCPSPPRVLIHVQHLLGTGHLRRAGLIAAQLAASGCNVTLASGGMPVPGLQLSGTTLVQLPPLASADSSFSRLVDRAGREVDAGWWAVRRDRLLALYQQVRPQLVIIESYPFGRRSLRPELLPLLQRTTESQPRPLLVCSIRDVLHARRSPARIDETVALLERYFDRVMVHGDPSLIGLEESFPAYQRIAERCYYTGMVAPPPAPLDASAAGEVLVSAGGGATGERLLAAALEARPQCRVRASPWRLLTGSNLDQPSYRRLQRQAPPGVVVERARSDFRARLGCCALSISQGGYNTVTDLLSSNARSVIVPFEGNGETEQRQRAERLAQRGWTTVLLERDLTGPALAAAIDSSLVAAPPRVDAVDLGGATGSVQLLRIWLGSRQQLGPA